MKKLPSDSIRLLSSSQVITSPSSVVKELVENSLDARATCLCVKLEKFGLEKIQVIDNGCGIKRSDTEFMAQQYYTSKICNHEDLEKLETYGFRGEALASLCLVADVDITTRTTEDSVAMSYHLDHAGKVCSVKPTHDGVGTNILASNLFKSIPVRKQCFSSIKKSKEELKRIEIILMAYGLINPETWIVLKHNKNVIWQKNKCPDIRTALSDVFGVLVVSQFDHFEYYVNEFDFSVQYFVPKNDSDPQIMWRSTDERSFIFINKRYVIWKELTQVLKKQCVSSKHKEMSSGKYPVCLVNICLSSKDVDANIEPNKTQVIINHKEEVLESLRKELCKTYDVNDSHTAATIRENTQVLHGLSSVKTSCRALAGEKTDLEQNSESRAPQKTSEAASRTSSSENEKYGDVEVAETNAAVVNLLTSSKDATTEHEGRLNQEESTDSYLANSDSSCEATWKPGSSIVSDSLQRSDFISTRESSLENNTATLECDLSCKERNNSASLVSTLVEKQNDLIDGCELDGLLEDIINDPDMCDHSLVEKAQPGQEGWSKGRCLIDVNEKEIEPFKLLSPNVRKQDEKRAASNGKRKNDVCDKNCSANPDRPNKRSKKYPMISGQSLLTSLLESPLCKTSTRITKSKEVTVPFSLSALKQLAARKRSSIGNGNDNVQLIKRLDPWGVWLVHKKRKLYILNPYRIQELLLYKKLLATHVIPREKLGKPIALDERVLGGVSRYSLLKKLVIKSNNIDNVRCCDDERLLFNGFEITARLVEETREVRMSLVKMNTTIPYFGVSDLAEILDLIDDNGTTSDDLASCRTTKVCSFLKDEVTRISRSLPSRMTDTDIVELLKNMKENLNENEKTCVHDRALLYPLMPY